jgi:hypothetical protein
MPASYGDRLGKLALSDRGIFCQEMQVLSTCAAQGYPVDCAIGGRHANEWMYSATRLNPS